MRRGSLNDRLVKREICCGAKLGVWRVKGLCASVGLQAFGFAPEVSGRHSETGGKARGSITETLKKKGLQSLRRRLLSHSVAGCLKKLGADQFIEVKSSETQVTQKSK